MRDEEFDKCVRSSDRHLKNFGDSIIFLSLSETKVEIFRIKFNGFHLSWLATMLL